MVYESPLTFAGTLTPVTVFSNLIDEAEVPKVFVLKEPLTTTFVGFATETDGVGLLVTSAYVPTIATMTRTPTISRSIALMADLFLL
jgi:hypothetical protein